MRIGPLSGLLASVVTSGMQLWHKFTPSTWSGSNRLPDSSPVGTNTASLNTGEALSFDGVNDVVTIGNTAASVRTVVFYANPSTTTQSFMQLQSTGAVRVQIASGTLSATGFTSPSLFINGVPGSTVSASTWTMIAVTSATAVTASNVLLGQQNTTFYQGSMANVKMFSTQLTRAQLTELYSNPELAIPTGSVVSDLVGWWPMMEGVGTAVYPGAGNFYGAISGATWTPAIGSALPQTGVGDGATPMCFDGTDDRVTISSANVSFATSAQFSVSTWFVWTGSANSFLYGTSSAGNQHGINIGATGLLQVYAGSYISTAQTLTKGRLYHFTYTWNNQAVKAWLNGTQVLNTTVAFTLPACTVMTIGSLADATLAFQGIVLSFTLWNTELTAGNAASLYNSGSYTNMGNVAAANIVAQYLNRGASLGNWADLKNSNHATSIGGTPNRVFLPELGTGTDIFTHPCTIDNVDYLTLTGDGYASVSDAASLDITTAITIEAWVKPYQVSAAQTILGKNSAYALNISSAAKLQFSKWTSAANATLSSSASITALAWTHVAVTYSTGACVLYINGTADTSSAALTGSLDATSTAVLLGALTTSSQQFTGQIDSVKVYNSALAAADIAKNYAAERGQFQ